MRITMRFYFYFNSNFTFQNNINTLIFSVYNVTVLKSNVTYIRIYGKNIY